MKPCPWCSRTPDPKTCVYERDDQVSCECGARGPIADGDSSGDERAGALRLWDQRVSREAPDLDALVERGYGVRVHLAVDGCLVELWRNGKRESEVFRDTPSAALSALVAAADEEKT